MTSTFALYSGYTYKRAAMSHLHDSIDFSLLAQPITSAEIKQYTPQKHKTLDATVWQAGIVIGFLAVMLVFCVVASFHPGQPVLDIFTSYNYWLFVIVIAFTTISILAIISRINAKRIALLNRFAVANNITLESGVSPAGHSGLIFQHGSSQVIKDVFTFPDGTEIGNYSYITGSGRSKRVHTWGYACMRLNRDMPHMVLDATQNNLFQRFSNLPDTFGNEQKLSLEGDFDSYFTLYAPAQYKRDALYLFTPDVMAKFIDHGKSYDIEVIDDVLYMYSATVVRLESGESLRTILEIIDVIADEIKDQNQNYRDEHHTTLDAVTTQSSIAPQGMRLKKKLNIVSVGFTIIMVVLYIFLITRPD